MNKVDILGVKINNVSLEEAVDECFRLAKLAGKHLIVTPNVEFLMKAQSDQEFKAILNSADLSIPDSARLGWAQQEFEEKNSVKKILLWPLFLMPSLMPNNNFPTVPGVDLMERVVKDSGEKGLTVGLFGGEKGVAEKAKECLIKKYPNTKIIFAVDGINVSDDGSCENPPLAQTDFIFIALGQGKQEKWINRYKDAIPGKVFMGVGGAFDYLSGNIGRAPGWMRSLGLEWLYRLFKQPSRAIRFISLIKFTFLILAH